MDSEERPNKKRRLTNDEHDSTHPKGAIQSSPVPDITSSIDELNPPTKYENYKPGHKAAQANGDTNNDQASMDRIPLLQETAPFATALSQGPAQAPLSKNQQKKLAKKAEWEAKRGERKALRKEKLIAKRERRREERALHPPPAPAEPKPKPQKSVTLPITFLIDCSFDDLMRDPERVSLAAQITRCYSDNRNALFRAHLAICSFGGFLRERFEKVLEHFKGWRGVRFLDEGFVEAAELTRGWMMGEDGGTFKGAFADSKREDAAEMERLKQEAEIVYLTSEAETVLQELKPFSTYIIGGLVDKNREKGICYRRATEAGVKTARLPIGEFMDMQSRKVLAVNHVNEIMIRWLECRNWGEAFMKVIPKRKGGTLKGEKERPENADNAEAEEDCRDEIDKIKDGNQSEDEAGGSDTKSDETFQ